MARRTAVQLSSDWGQFEESQAFSEPEQLLAAYFAASTVGLAICNPHLRYQAINNALAAMNGFPAEEHLGKTLREILGSAAGEVEQAMRRVLVTGKPILNLELALKLPTRKDVGYWIVNYFPVKDRAGRAKQVGVVALEITAQKKLEESLHALTGKLLRIKDEEQQRVARELHDSISQYHAALKMNLRLMSRPKFPARKRSLLLAQSADLLEHCIAETRTISHLLHPPSLDKIGFASAAKWYVKGFAQRSGIQVNLQLPKNLARLPSNAEIALFRVLQEALTNVHRHARTSVVDLCITRGASMITLRVKDYGRGIRAGKLRRLQEMGNSGVGVASMRERIHELGGTLKICSDEQGTEVEAVIPLSGGVHNAVQLS